MPQERSAGAAGVVVGAVDGPDDGPVDEVGPEVGPVVGPGLGLRLGLGEAGVGGSGLPLSSEVGVVAGDADAGVAPGGESLLARVRLWRRGPAPSSGTSVTDPVGVAADGRPGEEPPPTAA
ncbi:hypothetical protein ACWCV9_23670 [Streptomyces sp. NPDC001606]